MSVRSRYTSPDKKKKKKAGLCVEYWGLAAEWTLQSFFEICCSRLLIFAWKVVHVVAGRGRTELNDSWALNGGNGLSGLSVGENYCFVGDTVVTQHKFILLISMSWVFFSFVVVETFIVSASVSLAFVSPVLYSHPVGQLLLLLKCYSNRLFYFFQKRKHAKRN